MLLFLSREVVSAALERLEEAVYNGIVIAVVARRAHGVGIL